MSESQFAVLKAFLSVDELAAYLGVAPKTIYDWKYKGVGPRVTKVGRALRYRATDVEAWLDSQSTTAG